MLYYDEFKRAVQRAHNAYLEWLRNNKNVPYWEHKNRLYRLGKIIAKLRWAFFPSYGKNYKQILAEEVAYYTKFPWKGMRPYAALPRQKQAIPDWRKAQLTRFIPRSGTPE